MSSPIQWLVDRVHVNTSYEDLEEDMTARRDRVVKKGADPDALDLAGVLREAFERHRANRLTYAAVMRTADPAPTPTPGQAPYPTW